MMRTCLLLLLFITTTYGFSTHLQDNYQVEIDSIVCNKNTDIETNRSFKTNLKEKYNGNDFKYVDNLKAPKNEAKNSKLTTDGVNFLAVFLDFMTSIFPFILGAIVVFIILKTFIGSDVGFWSFKSATKKVADQLIYEDENIHDTDFSKLLEKAISDTDFRLATRYYYLSLLKKLSDKKTISYHKDKTNTEYVFEIENKEIRSQFSDVSHIYSYVWYGEFPIDSQTFKTVEKKYKSIFNSIH
ncbi:DUF4129 domain-containing protein [Formosa sp. L2A11]|uniref:DUF4129 domain-containing protein n=1 Tax=Formosa sp. L2A11 TaxID=2686363 RepID=UPI00131D7E0B|nr:DUF4129 domain-containing protein [Formosa sp. L2A11]